MKPQPKVITMPNQKEESLAVKTIKKAANTWPSSFVSRKEIRAFTGGIISQGTIANLDCKGEGPSGAFKIGRHVAYPVDSLIDWLVSRIKE
jgi:hypothetical protein